MIKGIHVRELTAWETYNTLLYGDGINYIYQREGIKMTWEFQGSGGKSRIWESSTFGNTVFSGASLGRVMMETTCNGALYLEL